MGTHNKYKCTILNNSLNFKYLLIWLISITLGIGYIWYFNISIYNVIYEFIVVYLIDKCSYYESYKVTNALQEKTRMFNIIIVSTMGSFDIFDVL